ncbi:MAG: Transcriptional regulator [Acidimicrobiales bacterium]|nr:Transcriptional regulator [Acidimicrobiales bacterium]
MRDTDLDPVIEVERLIVGRRLDMAAAVARAALAAAVLPPREAAGLRLTLSSLLLMNGYPDQAVGQAETVLAEAGLDEQTYSSAHLSLMSGLMAHGQFAAARISAVALLTGTPPADPHASLAGAFTTMGSIAWTDGRVADSIVFLRAAVARAEHDRLADRALHPRQCLSVPLVALGEFDEAESLLAADDADPHAAGAVGWTIGTHVRRARLWLARGRLAQASVEAVTAIDRADRSGARLFVPVARTTLAVVAFHGADVGAATAHLARLRQEPPPALTEHVKSDCAWIEARMAHDEHGPEAAVRMLRPIYDDLTASKRMLLEEPGIAAWMVRAALAAGDRAKAVAAMAGAEQLAADNPGLPSVGAISLHARGIYDRNVTALLGAAAAHVQPWARASAAEDASRMLAGAGDATRARDPLVSAIAWYREAGAHRDVARTTRKLDHLAARPRGSATSRPSSGWTSLTDRERRIAALVAEGLTNVEVGERLFLSRHTVDFHLRQVFRKLDIHSRAVLARLAADRRHPEQKEGPAGRQ